MQIKKILSIFTLGAILCAPSCVKINNELGQNLIPQEHEYDVFHEEIPLKNIRVMHADSTYGYNTYRIIVGAVNDADFGSIRKSAAFTLIPVDTSLNFGTDPKFESMFLTISRDSLSTPHGANSNLIQKMRIYALDENTDLNNPTEYMYAGDIRKMSQYFQGKEMATDFPVSYSGEDTLCFHFKKSFIENLGQRLYSKAKNGVYSINNPDTLSNSSYLKDFPGLFLTCDSPVGQGGRFNLFSLKLALNTSDYSIVGNYAQLRVNTQYEGRSERTDTSFIFLIGAAAIPQDANNLPLQSAFNGCEHEDLVAIDGMTKDGKYFLAKEKIYVEGGTGLRPVVSASEIRDSLLKRFAQHNIKESNYDKIIVDRASLIFNLIDIHDFSKLKEYPQMLSPMHPSRYKIKTTTYGEQLTLTYTDFPPISDASVSAEDPGYLNRSTLCYTPDITFHAQHLIKMKNPSTSDLETQDVWMFVKAGESITQEAVSSEESDYYNQMLYYSYLNSMYGGYDNYYGGYGSYGGYGYNNYNSYYSMMYYYSMMNANSGTTTNVQNMIDTGRHYKGILHGPEGSNPPVLNIVYSVPKDCIK